MNGAQSCRRGGHRAKDDYDRTDFHSGYARQLDTLLALALSFGQCINATIRVLGRGP